MKERLLGSVPTCLATALAFVAAGSLLAFATSDLPCSAAESSPQLGDHPLGAALLLVGAGSSLVLVSTLPTQNRYARMAVRLVAAFLGVASVAVIVAPPFLRGV